MATDASESEEWQRREPEKVRRSLLEMGNRTGLLSGPRLAWRRPGWAVAAVVALICLLVGGGVGYLLPRPATGAAEPAVTIVMSVPQTRMAVPRSCLEAARKGDATINLLVQNVRDRRLNQALKDYIEASQACRNEASP